jgi:hypothetical protein
MQNEDKQCCLVTVQNEIYCVFDIRSDKDSQNVLPSAGTNSHKEKRYEAGYSVQKVDKSKLINQRRPAVKYLLERPKAQKLQILKEYVCGQNGEPFETDEAVVVLTVHSFKPPKQKMEDEKGRDSERN